MAHNCCLSLRKIEAPATFEGSHRRTSTTQKK
jgi:hypothetical protein